MKCTVNELTRKKNVHGVLRYMRKLKNMKIFISPLIMSAKKRRNSSEIINC
jgi:hypothetical protein